jgi:hypothetical protein
MDPNNTPQEHVVNKHICGRCNDEFLTEQEYLDHVCAATGYQPTDPQHHGPEFAAVQKAALERGMEVVIANGGDQAQVDRQQAAIEAVTPPETPAQ